MKTTKYKVGRYIKRCWREISFKDKGLILIMIVLLLQCIHNLYSPAPTSQSYMTINLIIRTSVAAIFGYFLSSNFLPKLAIDKSIDDIDSLFEFGVTTTNGSGLGLFYAKKYMEDIKGKIDIVPNEDKGISVMLKFKKQKN